MSVLTKASQSLRLALLRTQTILVGIRFSLLSITSTDSRYFERPRHLLLRE